MADASCFAVDLSLRDDATGSYVCSKFSGNPAGMQKSNCATSGSVGAHPDAICFLKECNATTVTTTTTVCIEKVMSILGDGCCRVNYSDFIGNSSKGTQEECLNSCAQDENCVAANLAPDATANASDQYFCTTIIGSGAGLRTECEV